ncbi:Cytochrome P450 [Mycena chlorophos]|uniref:Cytochrome P450 n=1 Tax=Mycena chlorophos TaxID=658473 RepID=A0A8H6RXL2_MYCCL|nr:Cytochrome P450 [Mycena chlorophos]
MSTQILSTLSTAACTSVALLLTYYGIKVFKSWVKPGSYLPYPPGPRPLPLVGNKIPTVFPWLTYTEWGNQYGPIMHIKTFSEHIIIINSAKVANDLLEKRSHIYSDRPQIPMISLTRMGWDVNLGFMQYGDKWRRHKRLMHQYFRHEAAIKYQPIHLQKVHGILRKLLVNPTEFRDHIRYLAAAIIMAVVYGYDIAPANDQYVALAEAAVQKLGESVFPGAKAVNTFPFLRHLPGWLPGFGFQRFCNDTRALVNRMMDEPYEFAKKNMATGADTTVSALTTFFLAMALYPDIQKKAQAAIDQVVGSARLPDFYDRDKLPYIEAIYQEVMRWKPVLPLSVSHATTSDDIYQGYYIPKGATVIANLWAMSYDEDIYPEAANFQPERHLHANGQLIQNSQLEILAFGHVLQLFSNTY